MSPLLVSVVLPVRNGERWLRAAIESLLAQTVEDLEIVAVDDGSDDATPQILRQFEQRDARVRAVRQAPSGLVSALNHGLDEARAPLIARLDADDLALPQRLERQLQYLARNEQVGLLGSWAQEIDEYGRPTGWIRPATDSAAIARALLKGNPMIHSSIVMRTELVRRVGGYRRAFQGAEDYDLWLRLSEAASLANLPETLIQYRRHGANVTSRQSVRQAFSVRLAQRSMQQRRSGRRDEATALSGPPDWDAPEAMSSFYAEDASLYRILHLGDPNTIWTTTCDNIDFEPMLTYRPGLNHAEQALAASAFRRSLAKASPGRRRRMLGQFVRLVRQQPKFGLKVGWQAMRAAPAP